MTNTTMRESIYPSENVTLNMTVHMLNDKEGDTVCDIDGRFALAGSDRAEFTKKLGQLIDNYRI